MSSKNFTTALAITGMIISAFIACADSGRRQENDIFSKFWNVPDSTARSIMGNRLSELIVNPKKVEMYSVVFRDSIHFDNELVDTDFVIDSLICKLSKEQIAVLNHILTTDGSNFEVDTLAIPMIPHRPTVAFNFKNKNDNAIIWYSPDDFTWGIKYDGRNLFWYNVAYPSVINRFCDKMKNQ